MTICFQCNTPLVLPTDLISYQVWGVALRSGIQAAHQKLTQVQHRDFAIWLDLFKQTLADTAPTPEAADYFMERADRIARSLQMAMFDRPGVFADC